MGQRYTPVCFGYVGHDGNGGLLISGHPERKSLPRSKVRARAAAPKPKDGKKK